MSIPLFSKLNKKFADLYTDKRESYYNLSNRLVVEQKTRANVTLKSTVKKAACAKDVAGCVNVKYTPDCGEFEGNFGTCGAIKLKGKCKKLIPDAVVGLELKGSRTECSTKLFGEYVNKNFTVEESLTVNRDLSANGSLAAVAGAKGLAVGLSVSYAYAKSGFSLNDYQIAGRYVVPKDKDLTIAFGTSKRLTNFYTNFVYKACFDLELGAGVSYTRAVPAAAPAPAEGDGESKEAPAADAPPAVPSVYEVNLAAAYDFDSKTSFRTKWSSNGTAAFAVRHKLDQPKVQFDFTTAFKKATACTEGAEGETETACSPCPISPCGMVPAGYGVGITFGSFDA